jgi:L-lactate dehydrogenase complex protein LldG
MNSRDKILNEIKAGKTVVKEVTIGPMKGIEFADKITQFKNVLTSIGGECIECSNAEAVANYIQQETLKGKRVIHVKAQQVIHLSIEEMYALDTLIIEGSFGVAENAAIWIKEQDMGNRVLPFSCQQLVVVLSAQNMVHNMHEAYDLVSLKEDGYGVFIAGPSKTADIEQSLVIGAHGPVSFLVFLVN